MRQVRQTWGKASRARSGQVKATAVAGPFSSARTHAWPGLPPCTAAAVQIEEDLQV